MPVVPLVVDGPSGLAGLGDGPAPAAARGWGFEKSRRNARRGELLVARDRGRTTLGAPRLADDPSRRRSERPHGPDPADAAPESARGGSGAVGRQERQGGK